VQQDLQDAMQNLVGIVRTEAEMQEALVRIEQLKERSGALARRVIASTTPDGIPRLTFVTCCRSLRRSRARRSNAKESRGGHFREDYPEKVVEYGTINIMVKQTPAAAWWSRACRFRRCRKN
jgi:succinate dehydrogenase / fumarate reductase flavoprotein subunit